MGGAHEVAERNARREEHVAAPATGGIHLAVDRSTRRKEHAPVVTARHSRNARREEHILATPVTDGDTGVPLPEVPKPSFAYVKQKRAKAAAAADGASSRRSLLGICTARATDAKAAPPTSRTAALVADSQSKPPKAGDVVLLNGQPCRLDRVKRPSLFQKFQLSGRHIFSGQRFETMCSPRVSWHSVRTPSAS